MAIVSAKGGVTDLLIGVVTAALSDMDAAAAQLRAATDAQARAKGHSFGRSNFGVNSE